MTIARGWWVAAWLVFVATFICGLLLGRFAKQPLGFLLAGIAAGLALIITQPALNP